MNIDKLFLSLKISMKNVMTIFFLIFVFHGSLFAQVFETKNWCLSVCDIVGDEKNNTELLHLQMKNDSIMNLVNTKGIRRIPLRIGIVQDNYVKVELDEIVVRRAIENLNKSFVEAGYLFYIDRTDVIISKLKLEDLSSKAYAPYNKFSDKYDEPDMLSVYIFDHGKEYCDIKPTSISCGRTGGFSYILSERTNNIVMSRFDLSDMKVFTHEMGHFWGLYHTFEEAQFGKDDFKKENCDKLGDRICDTPPDPGSVFEVYVNYSTCEMMNLKNENGFEYKPLLSNYMTYYKPCYLKKFSFTPEQITLLKASTTLPFREKFIK